MSKTPEEIQEDIEQQREQLAQTVDQLGHKLDVKAQSKAKVEDVKAQTQASRLRPTPARRGQGAQHHRRRQASPRGHRRGRSRGRWCRDDHLAAAAPMSRSDVRQEQSEGRTKEQMPHPDDNRKPDGPSDLKKRSWFYVLRKTMHEFTEDQCTDLAAALTYYAVLAIFPAMIALISVLGVIGQGPKAVDTIKTTLEPLVSESVLTTITENLNGVANAPGAGLALIVGLLLALWSASGYVGAFGRAMNKIYEIEEGRPFWKLRPIMLLLTLIAVILAAIALLMLIVSGPVAESVGNLIGLGSTAITVWSIAKWPVLALIVIIVVALLYYATPNVQQPKFRWISVGAGVAILVWVLASVGFAFYVANFSSYNKTYGSLAGVIITLLFLWITNLALLFGGELDAELERGRQLQAGIAAEEELQLPARDTRNIKKAEKKRNKDAALGRKIRREAAANGTSDREHSSQEGKK